MLTESKKPVVFLSEMVNVASKLMHKKGVFVVLQLTDEAIALGSIDVNALKAEWPEGSLESNVKELCETSKAKLDLENKDNEAKVKAVLDLAAEGVVIGGKVISLVKKAQSIFA